MYSKKQDIILQAGRDKGWDMSFMENEAYTPEQMLQLYCGCLSGVDINFFSNPGLNSEEMKHIRMNLEEVKGFTATMEMVQEVEDLEKQLKGDLRDYSVCAGKPEVLTKEEEVERFEALEELNRTKDLFANEIREAVDVSGVLKAELVEGKSSVKTPNARLYYEQSFESEGYIYMVGRGLTTLKFKKEEVIIK